MSKMLDSFRKNCVFCQHFVFRPGDYGYSDATPGYDAQIRCGLFHWEVNLYRDYEETFHEYMQSAQTCKDFKLTDLVKLDDK